MAARRRGTLRNRRRGGWRYWYEVRAGVGCGTDAAGSVRQEGSARSAGASRQDYLPEDLSDALRLQAKKEGNAPWQNTYLDGTLPNRSGIRILIWLCWSRGSRRSSLATPRSAASPPASTSPRGRCGLATGATCCSPIFPTTGSCGGMKPPAVSAFSATRPTTPTATRATARGV